MEILLGMLGRALCAYLVIKFGLVLFYKFFFGNFAFLYIIGLAFHAFVIKIVPIWLMCLAIGAVLQLIKYVAVKVANL